MEILVNKLIPRPLLDFSELDSEVWLKPSLRFLSNERYLIYSPSGKGKTSLLSIIYGSRNDYDGEVFMNEDNIKNFSMSKWIDLRRTKISMVFQGLKLFDKLTVEENILLKNKLTDFATEREILFWMDNLDIKSLFKKRVGEISFGQQQRVAIIRALCQPFELLLLDEPFSHIDSENKERALSLIHQATDNQSAMMILSSLKDTLNNNFKKYKI